MSELIVSKPFLRGTQRFRRGEPVPTNLDKPTLNEYLRLGLIGPKKPSTPAPGNTKPATQPGGGATPGPRKREAAAPKEVKSVAGTPPAAATDASSVVPAPLLGDSGGDDAVGESAGPDLPVAVTGDIPASMPLNSQT